MFKFLDMQYWRNQSDELGGLLGSMALLADGTPADPSLAKDWNIAVHRVMKQSVKMELNSELTYSAAIEFLSDWAAIGTDGTISGICGRMKSDSPQNEDWISSVNCVLADEDDPYLHLTSEFICYIGLIFFSLYLQSL